MASKDPEHYTPVLTDREIFPLTHMATIAMNKQLALVNATKMQRCDYVTADHWCKHPRLAMLYRDYLTQVLLMDNDSAQVTNIFLDVLRGASI